MGKKNKDKKAKLPKQVAGVKIPKVLREQGKNLVVDLARNPMVAEVAAAGLVAVAAALRGSAKSTAVAAPAEKPAADAAGQVKAGLSDLANLALAAATQGLQAFAEAARDKPVDVKKDGKVTH